MTILKNVMIRYARLNPDRPSTKVNKKGEWQVQAYTRDKEQVKEWKKEGITVKLAEDAEGIIYTVNFRKKATKKDGTPGKPPTVVNSKLVAIDPKSVGNGSVVNLNLSSYDYTFEGKSGLAFQLNGLQILKHVVFKPKPFDGFSEEEGETEVVDEMPDEAGDEEGGDDKVPDVKW